jgi:hypothetical protein
MRKETTTFNRRAAQALVDELWEQKRRLIASHTATQQRHQAVYMPPSAAEYRMVRYDHLPAAYGGTGTQGISGAAATSNGNISPTNRKIYPKLWQNAYVINSSGEYEADTTTGYVVNLGSLPLKTGWGLASKLPIGSHPDFTELWAVMPDAPSHYGTADFTWLSEENSGDWTLKDGEAILLRGASGSSTGVAATENWAFPWGGDVMLSHMGLWEVTFGYRGYVDSSDYPYYDHTVTGGGGGTYRLPMGFIVQVGIHRNFESGTSVVGTNPDTTLEMRNHHTFSNDFFSSTNWRTSHEKTVYVESDQTPWHGQHHTRLSMYIKVTLDPLASSAGTPSFAIDQAWMNIRPARRNGRTGLSDGFGTGANQYPGGYSGGTGTFVWYGGGTEPDMLDKDGGVI